MLRMVVIWAALAAMFLSITTVAANAQTASQNASNVIFFSAKQLDAEIHKAPEDHPGTSFIDLIEYSPEKGGISITRRTKPTRADVHQRLIDTWYVIKGSGTLVTGGALVEPVTISKDELRGRGIAGGDERHIAPGDFVRIPAGVPHWIRKIDGDEIYYLVVKVASEP